MGLKDNMGHVGPDQIEKLSQAAEYTGTQFCFRENCFPDCDKQHVRGTSSIENIINHQQKKLREKDMEIANLKLKLSNSNGEIDELQKKLSESCKDIKLLNQQLTSQINENARLRTRNQRNSCISNHANTDFIIDCLIHRIKELENASND